MAKTKARILGMKAPAKKPRTPIQRVTDAYAGDLSDADRATEAYERSLSRGRELELLRRVRTGTATVQEVAEMPYNTDSPIRRLLAPYRSRAQVALRAQQEAEAQAAYDEWYRAAVAAVTELPPEVQDRIRTEVASIAAAVDAASRELKWFTDRRETGQCDCPCPCGFSWGSNLCSRPHSECPACNLDMQWDSTCPHLDEQ